MTDHHKLAELRKTYEHGSLDDEAAAAEPLAQFSAWLGEALAKGLPEPNAMSLATVGEDGRPSSRIVLVKGCDERGIV